MTKHFQDLEDSREPKIEQQKVNILLTQVYSSNPDVIKSTTLICHSCLVDFINGCNAMTVQIANIFFEVVEGNPNKKCSSVVGNRGKMRKMNNDSGKRSK